jgi:peptide-methionine (R)-S-oxide reductase
LLYHFQDGVYRCAGCATELFSSDSKYDSGTGWPSFWSCLDGGVRFRNDPLHGMHRLEALCSGCEGHLGHLFDDQDSPTDQRFCINSAALDFQAEGPQ